MTSQTEDNKDGVRSGELRPCWIEAFKNAEKELPELFRELDEELIDALTDEFVRELISRIANIIWRNKNESNNL